ncbi:Hsp20/alpha crystallin family protein [Haliscomenobacter hydrossis]|uniref:Heat shock protein Hsp20 n=1 Tax=Haliscomenobacter hydrossis (strain ATCC 27775 / DSM 1100 / LMG 10767 / O) TaxID=760192 RepID=F4KU81_HALH1|nr:Hsp20/alpha crystallin family protein [Haliscomenobacter hydrossis]AEE50178.1 heat shock protein Hsp20 [Haliscomenobacter hydrossis DSM 1100]
MSIVRWNPMVAPTFRSLVEDFFGDSDFLNFKDKNFVPAVNIKEMEGEFEVELAVPGMTKEDIKVEVLDGILTISAEKNDKKEEKTKKYTRREFSYNKFSRSFTLPEHVDPEAIKANYVDGVLHLALPKMVKTALPEAKKILIG